MDAFQAIRACILGLARRHVQSLPRSPNSLCKAWHWGFEIFGAREVQSLGTLGTTCQAEKLDKFRHAVDAPAEGLYILALYSRAGHHIHLGRYQYKRLIEHVLWTSCSRPQRPGEEELSVSQLLLAAFAVAHFKQKDSLLDDLDAVAKHCEGLQSDFFCSATIGRFSGVTLAESFQRAWERNTEQPCAIRGCMHALAFAGHFATLGPAKADTGAQEQTRHFLFTRATSARSGALASEAVVVAVAAAAAAANLLLLRNISTGQAGWQATTATSSKSGKPWPCSPLQPTPRPDLTQANIGRANCSGVCQDILRQLLPPLREAIRQSLLDERPLAPQEVAKLAWMFSSGRVRDNMLPYVGKFMTCQKVRRESE
eukprot:s3059_g8.t1